jgi:maltooligosyltrehalose trehalohydrolase
VAATLLCAPSLPLIFMGEEHADPAPFFYFTDFGDAPLARAVADGRRREFGQSVDPQSPAAFTRSRIDLTLGERGRHAGVYRFYRALLALRRERPSLRTLDRARTLARAQGHALTLRRFSDEEEVLLLVALADRPARLEAPAPRRGQWSLLLDAGDFGGPPGARRVARDRALTVELPPWGALLLCA